jgi:hypothetical protein
VFGGRRDIEHMSNLRNNAVKSGSPAATPVVSLQLHVQRANIDSVWDGQATASVSAGRLRSQQFA